jgi:hypothetical protein
MLLTSVHSFRVLRRRHFFSAFTYFKILNRTYEVKRNEPVWARIGEIFIVGTGMKDTEVYGNSKGH